LLEKLMAARFSSFKQNIERKQQFSKNVRF